MAPRDVRVLINYGKNFPGRKSFQGAARAQVRLKRSSGARAGAGLGVHGLVPIVLAREGPEDLRVVDASPMPVADAEEAPEHPESMFPGPYGRRALVPQPHGHAPDLEVVLEGHVEQLDVSSEAILAEQGEQSAGHVAAEGLQSALRVVQAAGHQHADDPAEPA